MQHRKSKSKRLLILPALIQSKTKEREESTSISIVTLNTPDTESDNDTSSASTNTSMTTYMHYDFLSEASDEEQNESSSSSDWDTSISMASAYLPRNVKKSNSKLHLKPYNSFIEKCNDKASQHKLQQINDINNMLFYPYNNLQSLIFSNSYCYIENDYKQIKNVNLNDDNTKMENKNQQNHMNWKDIQCVNKIKELLHNLLISASYIREEEIYLMFSSPSPQQIIEQLRFGILSILCDVTIDRFGRRSYYYRRSINHHRTSKILYGLNLNTVFHNQKNKNIMYKLRQTL